MPIKLFISYDLKATLNLVDVEFNTDSIITSNGKRRMLFFSIFRAFDHELKTLNFHREVFHKTLVEHKLTSITLISAEVFSLSSASQYVTLASSSGRTAFT